MVDTQAVKNEEMQYLLLACDMTHNCNRSEVVSIVVAPPPQEEEMDEFSAEFSDVSAPMASDGLHGTSNSIPIMKSVMLRFFKILILYFLLLIGWALTAHQRGRNS
ncbi:MAG TPA: hypothetical protein VJA22_01760 [Patescibacteria group bacterium]|nr:hypothetical protein [Patescibacteria group bacterium]